MKTRTMKLPQLSGYEMPRAATIKLWEVNKENLIKAEPMQIVDVGCGIFDGTPIEVRQMSMPKIDVYMIPENEFNKKLKKEILRSTSEEYKNPDKISVELTYGCTYVYTDKTNKDKYIIYLKDAPEEVLLRAFCHEIFHVFEFELKLKEGTITNKWESSSEPIHQIIEKTKGEKTVLQMKGLVK